MAEKEISDNRLLTAEEFCVVFEIQPGTEMNAYQQYLQSYFGIAYPYYDA